MINDKYLTKIIAASLLGDGHVTNDPNKAHTKNSRYEISQIIQHTDYIEYLQQKLQNLTNIKISYRDFPNMPNANRQIKLSTQHHPFYTKFRNRMYGVGIKHVDPHYLTLIDAEFMAIWYSEDGSKALNIKNSQESVYLYTDSFGYADNDLLRKAIIEKTGFVFNIHQRKNKNGLIKYRLYLYKKQNQDFYNYISPFIVPSFRYKLSDTIDS